MSTEVYSQQLSLKRMLAAAGLAGSLLLTQTACHDAQPNSTASVEHGAERATSGVTMPDDTDRLLMQDLAMCAPDAKPSRIFPVIFRIEGHDEAMRRDSASWADAPTTQDLANEWFPDEYTADTLVTYGDPTYAGEAQADAEAIDAWAADKSGATKGAANAVQVLTPDQGFPKLPFAATVTYNRDAICPM
jgi:hypothetical protein